MKLLLYLTTPVLRVWSPSFLHHLTSLFLVLLALVVLWVFNPDSFHFLQNWEELLKAHGEKKITTNKPQAEK